jgi:hypothetical protein
MNKISKNENGFSILEGIFIVIVIIVVGFIGSIVYFFHAANSQCGLNSPAHKTEQAKVSVFNAVAVMPDQPNNPASIYDSSQGTCNIDVAQSYSATKSYTVNTTGEAALTTVTDNLAKQGFKLSKEGFYQNDCSDVSSNANYSGKSIIITVDFSQPISQKCSSTIVFHPTQESIFTNTKISSIKATVSTPDLKIQPGQTLIQ